MYRKAYYLTVLFLLTTINTDAHSTDACNYDKTRKWDELSIPDHFIFRRKQYPFVAWSARLKPYREFAYWCLYYKLTNTGDDRITDAYWDRFARNSQNVPIDPRKDIERQTHVYRVEPTEIDTAVTAFESSYRTVKAYGLNVETSATQPGLGPVQFDLAKHDPAYFSYLADNNLPNNGVEAFKAFSKPLTLPPLRTEYKIEGLTLISQSEVKFDGKQYFMSSSLVVDSKVGVPVIIAPGYSAMRVSKNMKDFPINYKELLESGKALELTDNKYLVGATFPDVGEYSLFIMKQPILMKLNDQKLRFCASVELYSPYPFSPGADACKQLIDK